MRLVLGLGNPGRRYEGTRHNVAWEVLDTLATRWHAGTPEDTPEYVTRAAGFQSEPVVLMQPLTFMNRAGDALLAWRVRHPEADETLLVVTDDVYLQVGSLRIRPRGSSGGHRGLESIEQALGHRRFTRLRIGVGAADSSAGLREHVLDRFSPEERAQMDEAVMLGADVVECWLAEGVLVAMNRFNRRAGKEVREP